MEKMQTLNHATQCLEAWRESRELKDIEHSGDASLAAIFGFAKQALLESPKFMLPEGGRVLEDVRSIARLFDSIHLPYPMVALEFVAKGAVAAHETKSSKRVALCFDLAQKPSLLAQWSGRLRVNLPDHGLLVMSIAYTDDYQHWFPVLGFIHVDTTGKVQKFSADEIEPGLKTLIQHRIVGNGKNIESFPITCYALHEHLVQSLGLDEAINTIVADSSDEVLSAISFAALCACSNISHETLRAPEKLNRKRLDNGKVPFFDTRVLMSSLDVGNASGRGRANLGGTHASPRFHLRIGHIRVVGDKRIWINATTVNAHKEFEAPDAAVDTVRPRG